eukprot:15448664-Alexandrium_andersonii.AAC.1
MVAGPGDVAIANFKMTLATYFLAKDTGELRAGQTVRVIGRDLVREGAHIIVKLLKSYFAKVLEDLGLERSKRVTATGISAPADLGISFPDNWDAARELHQFRKVVGKLQWLVNVRPDVAFA